MKNLFLLSFLSIFLVYCGSGDPCENVTCQYSQDCVDGKCDCVDGLSGEFCEIAERDQFLGVWEGVILCEPNFSQEQIVMDIQRDGVAFKSVYIFINGSETGIRGDVIDNQLEVIDVILDTGNSLFNKATITTNLLDENTLSFQVISQTGISGPVSCVGTLLRE